MSTALQREPRKVPLTDSLPTSDKSAGFLVIEQRSTTPLGPKIVYANEAISELSGYELSSLIGSPLGLLYDRSDLAVLIEKLPAIAARPNHCFMDRVLLRNGGTRRPCHWTIRWTKREGDPRGFFALTVRPILPPTTPPPLPPATSSHTGTHESNETLPDGSGDTGRDYERCRSESISLAAAGVAHDFKNALQTIKMNLELAALTSASGSRTQSHINEAQLALGDAEILARQMLAFTRGGSGRRRALRIDQLLERVSRLCSAGSGIRCRLFLPENLRCVSGDPTQIYQVLHNLVINARQAMPTGGTIDIAAGNADLGVRNKYSMSAGHYTVASVRDRGCGIPEAMLSRIFEPDFTTKVNGSGFGLASCQAIVAAHGGAIRVASQVGVGTEFLVFLPSTDELPDSEMAFPVATIAQTPVRLQPHSGTGRVLVVEDQPGVARSTIGMLKQIGYESLHARDGEEAITLYREHLDSDEPVDVVLLDMTLPGGLSGMDVTAELQRLDPSVRIVATSGYFEEGVNMPAERQFAGVLPKPYGMSDLSEALESAVAS